MIDFISIARLTRVPVVDPRCRVSEEFEMETFWQLWDENHLDFAEAEAFDDPWIR